MNYHDTQLKVIPHRCRSLCCPDCSVSRGKYIRKCIHAKSPLFKIPRLFSFTVNPSSFSSPLDAYLFVRNHSFLPRLFRFLGLRRWISVFECQTNGFPHWHVVVDVSDLPSRFIKRTADDIIVSDFKVDDTYHKVDHYVDLSRIHRLWRCWGIGEQVEFSRVRGRKSTAHVFNYITKYIVKYPSTGYPKWLLELRSVRFVSSSRDVGSIYNLDSPQHNVDDSSDVDVESQRSSTNIATRVSTCSLSCDIISKDVTSRFIANLRIPLDALLKLSPDQFYFERFYSSSHKSYQACFIRPLFLDFLLNLDDRSHMIFNSRFLKKYKSLGFDDTPF